MRLRRAVIIVVLVAVVAGVALVLHRRYSTPPEQGVKLAVEDIRLGLETGSVGGVMKRIANDYWDGTNTKMDIRRLAMQALQSSQGYNVVINGITVDPMVPGAREAVVHIRADVSQKGTFSDAAAWPFTVDGAMVWTFWHGWQATSFTGWQLTVDKEMQGG